MSIPVYTRVSFTLPDAKSKVSNPYFNDFVLSQQLMLPPAPSQIQTCAFIHPRFNPTPPCVLQEEPTQVKLPFSNPRTAPKTHKVQRVRKHWVPQQLPKSAKEVYQFIDVPDLSFD